LSKHGDSKQTVQPCNESVPHLHPKPKQTNKNLPLVGKLFHQYLLFHKDDPSLPRIVLRAATPPEGPEFERCGSVFVLRESKPATRTVVGHLQVPKRKKRVGRRASLPPVKSLQEYMQDTGDIDLYLDAEYAADYRKYLAGLK
jgi:hypothetical protein